MAVSRKPKVKPARPPSENKAQSAVFLQTAKNLSADESGQSFDAAFNAIAGKITSADRESGRVPNVIVGKPEKRKIGKRER